MNPGGYIPSMEWGIISRILKKGIKPNEILRQKLQIGHNKEACFRHVPYQHRQGWCSYHFNENKIMKTIIQHIFIITAMVSASHVWAQSDPFSAETSQKDPYAEGLVAEERHQDFAKAAEYYQSVIQEFDAQRQEAAHAIFRLGECLRMLGRMEAAKVQYARILREFPDFVPLTKQSHTRLTNTSNDPLPSLGLGNNRVQAELDTNVQSKSEQVASQENEVHALDIEILKKHGLISETSALEMKSVQRFLGVMGIDLPVRFNSKYQVYGLWFNQGDFQKFDHVARSLYQNQEEEPSDALTNALLIYNDVEKVSAEDFDQEMKKLEKVFLPLLPQFFSDKAKQAWPNIASNNASETEGLYFTILGQVAHPDVYPMLPDQPIGIVEAIAKAGGFTQDSKQNRISLFRNGEEKHFNFDDLLKRKNLGDAKIMSGDRIVVPSRVF